MTPARQRLIFVNRVAWPSGAATAQLLADLVAGLADSGWKVHVITGGSGPLEHQGVIYHRTGGTERHSGLVSQYGNYARFQRRAREILRSLVQPGDLVVVLTDPPQLASALTPVIRQRGAKMAVWLQDIYPDILVAHGGRWLKPFVAFMARARDRAWRSASGCVVVSEDMRARVVRAGVDPAAVSVIPNWAPPDLASSPDPASVAEIRARWGVGTALTVAYSGNFGRVHLFEPVTAAAARLRDEPGIRFVFVGDGPRLAEVQSAVTGATFEPAQPRERLAATLAAADVHLVTLRPGFASLVFPSKFAGILAAGRPALYVGPPECEIADFVRSEGCGLAFAPGDDAGLAEALRRLRREPALRMAMGRAARAAYETHFTFSTALSAWTDRIRTWTS